MALKKLGKAEIGRATRPADFVTEIGSDSVFHLRSSATAGVYERLELAPVGRGGVWIVFDSAISVTRNILLNARGLFKRGSLEALANETERNRCHFITREDFDAWAALFREEAPRMVRQLSEEEGPALLAEVSEPRQVALRVMSSIVAGVIDEPDPQAVLWSRLGAEKQTLARRLQRDILIGGEPEVADALELALFALLADDDEVALRGDQVINLGTRSLGLPDYASHELSLRTLILADLIDQHLHPHG